MSDAAHGVGNAFTVVVNGEARSVKAGDTVSDLLAALGLQSGRVAIERNLKILPRTEWATTNIAAGDRYEIVQFVGGG
jgi:sulfur carrier protein